MHRRSPTLVRSSCLAVAKTHSSQINIPIYDVSTASTKSSALGTTAPFAKPIIVKSVKHRKPPTIM